MSADLVQSDHLATEVYVVVLIVASVTDALTHAFVLLCDPHASSLESYIAHKDSHSQGIKHT